MKSNRSFTFDELMTGNRSEEFIESAYPFMKLMMQYQCCLLYTSKAPGWTENYTAENYKGVSGMDIASGSQGGNSYGHGSRTGQCCKKSSSDHFF